MPSPKAAKASEHDPPPAEDNRLMPWEGGEPEVVDLSDLGPIGDKLEALFERRDRGHMTHAEAWACGITPNSIRGMDGRIYRFRS